METPSVGLLELVGEVLLSGAEVGEVEEVLDVVVEEVVVTGEGSTVITTAVVPGALVVEGACDPAPDCHTM